MNAYKYKVYAQGSSTVLTEGVFMAYTSGAALEALRAMYSGLEVVWYS